MCSHGDGSLTTWNVRIPGEPKSILKPHGKILLPASVITIIHGTIPNNRLIFKTEVNYLNRVPYALQRTQHSRAAERKLCPLWNVQLCIFVTAKIKKTNFWKNEAISNDQWGDISEVMR